MKGRTRFENYSLLTAGANRGRTSRPPQMQQLQMQESPYVIHVLAQQLESLFGRSLGPCSVSSQAQCALLTRSDQVCQTTDLRPCHTYQLDDQRAGMHGANLPECQRFHIATLASVERVAGCVTFGSPARQWASMGPSEQRAPIRARSAHFGSGWRFTCQMFGNIATSKRTRGRAQLEACILVLLSP